MEEALQPLRPANRKEPKLKAEPKIKTVGLSDSAFTQVEKSAKKLKMSKSKYASAAIAFFAESGLDPTAEQPQGLASVSRKVEVGVASVREHNADIGNRIYGLVRGFERTLHTFMQEQQLTTYTYLQGIESNLLRYLISLETNMLAPIMEQLVTAKVEAYIGRVVGERAYLEIREKPATDWTEQNKKINGERDQLVLGELRDFAEKNKVPTPRPNPKPAATPVPAKPTAPASTTPASPTTPPKV